VFSHKQFLTKPELLLITEVLTGVCGNLRAVKKTETISYTTMRGSVYGVRKALLYKTFYPLNLGNVQISVFNKITKLQKLLSYLN